MTTTTDTTTPAARNTMTAEGFVYTVNEVVLRLGAWEADCVRDAMQTARPAEVVTEAMARGRWAGAVAEALGVDADDVSCRGGLESGYTAIGTIAAADGATVDAQVLAYDGGVHVDPIDPDDLDAIPASAERVLGDWLGTAMQRAWEAAIAG